MRRTPIARKSAKQRVKDAAWREARELALERDGWWPVCHSVGFGPDHVHRGGIEVHHRLRRSQGGTNELSNLVTLCSAAHTHVHEHPEWAYEVGLLLRAGATS